LKPCFVNSKGKIIGMDEILEGGLSHATVMSCEGTAGAVEAAK
jgi:hypothetical protein